MKNNYEQVTLKEPQGLKTSNFNLGKWKNIAKRAILARVRQKKERERELEWRNEMGSKAEREKEDGRRRRSAHIGCGLMVQIWRRRHVDSPENQFFFKFS